jgi:hypothetical protein
VPEIIGIRRFAASALSTSCATLPLIAAAMARLIWNIAWARPLAASPAR